MKDKILVPACQILVLSCLGCSAGEFRGLPNSAPVQEIEQNNSDEELPDVPSPSKIEIRKLGSSSKTNDVIRIDGDDDDDIAENPDAPERAQLPVVLEVMAEYSECGISETWVVRDINSMADFMAVKTNGIYRLNTDLDLNGAAIGARQLRNVVFDGNGKTIANFTGGGLFGEAECMALINLNVIAAEIAVSTTPMPKQYVGYSGSLFRRLSRGYVDGISVTGASLQVGMEHTYQAQYVGGLIGFAIDSILSRLTIEVQLMAAVPETAVWDMHYLTLGGFVGRAVRTHIETSSGTASIQNIDPGAKGLIFAQNEQSTIVATVVDQGTNK